MSCLIVTMPSDMHAVYVHLALNKIGKESTLWYPSDFPHHQMSTFAAENSGNTFSMRNLEGATRQFDNIDVVWFRRPRSPLKADLINPHLLDPLDVDNAHQESHQMFLTFWDLIAQKATWINHYSKIRRANAKALQLQIASLCNLNIPKSLISNDPGEIKKFLNTLKREKIDVIYKSLSAMTWFESKQMRICYTQKTTIEDLPDDAILRASGGIFQEHIEKKFELRITIMGNDIYAVKINSQQHPLGHADWRVIPTHELSLDPFILPDAVALQLKNFMKTMELNFGCIDMIVDKDDNFIFLEVNEQGQFLWIEEVNPEIKMLSAFTHFVSSFMSDDNNLNVPTMSLSDFIEPALQYQKYAISQHIDPEMTNRTIHYT